MGRIPREPPNISTHELSEICSKILVTKTIHPDMLKRLAVKMASLPSDAELRQRADDRREANRKKRGLDNA